MGGRTAFRRGAVVARRTPGNDPAVREASRGPSRCPVASAAVLRCRNMSSRLTGGLCAIVAAGTGSKDLRVIYPGTRPRCGDMAERALVAGRNMCRGLASDLGAVVA